MVGYAESPEEWQRQIDALHEDLLAYHQLYDIYHNYDGLVNLQQVNRLAGEGPVKVDPRILNLLLQAKELYTVTSGQMNIAMGRPLSIWHTYREEALRDPAKARVPEPDKLAASAEHTKMDNLILDEENFTVFFKDPELRLDVGSVGKGYAAEMAARAAEERGLQSALLNVGGNLRSIGTKPNGTPWIGGIQNPWSDAGEKTGYLMAVELENEALVTSGDYQRFYVADGVKYHHIIDPDTLFPARYFSAVAVLAPDSGLADGLSTGLFCMEPEEGLALVESLDKVEALWMLADGSMVQSSGWQDHLKT
ncbi:Membrane-associated lipoprotein involved in thiamine biosynthesis [gut metagenome]|uniref:FAD:protein FMN transferase n=1 Tax=gut metagenome TaxID=749906 RepID=J9GQE1_9ZZZZ